MDERSFVTGALGWIGAWAVRKLVQAGAPVNVAGVAQTMELFKAAPADGLLSPPR